MEDPNFDKIILNLVKITLNILQLKNSNFTYESILKIIDTVYDLKSEKKIINQNDNEEEEIISNTNINNNDISWSSVVKHSGNIKVNSTINNPCSISITLKNNKFVNKPEFFNDEIVYKRLIDNAKKTNDWKFINTIFDYKCKNIDDVTHKLV